MVGEREAFSMQARTRVCLSPVPMGQFAVHQVLNERSGVLLVLGNVHTVGGGRKEEGFTRCMRSWW